MNFLDNLWQGSGGRWYGGTSKWAKFANASMLASFTVTFQGTSIAFVGSSPDVSPPYLVSIDGSEDTTSDYPELAVDSQWYTSEMLEDTLHSVQVSNLNGTDVDFAVVTIGENTPLEEQTIIVDDNSSEIIWNGQWQERTDYRYPTGITDARPFQDGAHISTDVGDTMAFQFAGE
ncbi:hypothetical protein VKT23_016093 [Stygiomarasmius scandens]|uniref:Lectin n=1 Tax=Marasmiellus scandens TaxID=2682957 RepID=A0ABR1IVR0_9AGAR